MDNQKLLQGRYRLLHSLGRGGQGAVFLAADQNLPGRRVAIKRNNKFSDELQEQFKREATILARLKHRNLPQVYDHFIEPSGEQYLVMEYIEGAHLRKIAARRDASRTEADILAWIKQVMAALAYMHTWVDPESQAIRPIIHRDIKPDNIKLTPDGNIYLVDFGLARYQTEDVTQAGARGSTSGFSPPEQYSSDDRSTDIRSDIYALGATFYFLLTRKRPRVSIDITPAKPLMPPRQLNPKISPKTEYVVLRAMQLQPEKRFQSIAEMQTALFSRDQRVVSVQLSAQQPRVHSKNRRLRQLRRFFLRESSKIRAVFGFPQGSQLEHRRHPVHRRESRPLSVPQVGMIASCAAIFVIILLLRYAPLPEMSELLEMPDVFQNLAAASTQSATPEVINTLAATPIFTHTSAPSSTPTALPIPTATPAPVQTQTATPAATPQPTIPATSTPYSTRIPVLTPVSTSRSTPIPLPTATSASALPVGSVILIAPLNALLQGRQIFRWTTDVTLSSAQYFELVFWQVGQDPMVHSFSPVGANKATTVTSNLDKAADLLPTYLISGREYEWGVLLVEMEPYRRLRYLGGGHRFRFARSVGSGGVSPLPTPGR